MKAFLLAMLGLILLGGCDTTKQTTLHCESWSNGVGHNCDSTTAYNNHFEQ